MVAFIQKHMVVSSSTMPSKRKQHSWLSPIDVVCCKSNDGTNERKTYPLPGTKEIPIVQVDEGRNYPTSFNFASLALPSKNQEKVLPGTSLFSPRSLREPAKSSKTHPPLPDVLEWTQWGFMLSLLASHSPCTYIWRGMLTNHLGSSNHFVF